MTTLLLIIGFGIFLSFRKPSFLNYVLLSITVLTIFILFALSVLQFYEVTVAERSTQFERAVNLASPNQ
jgi:uncharacterized Tic20 family protein